MARQENQGPGSGPARSDAFSRLQIDESYWFDAYTGSAEDLIAAELVAQDQLPGLDGSNRTMCTFYDGQPVRQGTNTARDEWYVQIRAVSKGCFRAWIGVPKDIERRRRDFSREADPEAWKARRVSPLGRHRPTARLIALPTAGAEPVHHESRPGRLPKGVISLHDARIARIEARHSESVDRQRKAIGVLEWALCKARQTPVRGLLLGIQFDEDAPVDLLGAGEWEPIAEEVSDRV